MSTVSDGDEQALWHVGDCAVSFVEGNIVNHKADGLISTGNIYLNMSGGVNGELLHQGGAILQHELHNWLKSQSRPFVKPGFVTSIGPEPFDFKCIVYAVAVDAFYQSSIELVKQCLERSFAILIESGCKSVAVPALATGYGRLSKHDFGMALRQLLEERGSWGFERIDVVCERNLEQVREGFFQC